MIVEAASVMTPAKNRIESWEKLEIIIQANLMLIILTKPSYIKSIS